MHRLADTDRMQAQAYISKAAQAGALAILECHRADGTPFPALCIVQEVPGGFSLQPFARLITADELSDVIPPTFASRGGDNA